MWDASVGTLDNNRAKLVLTSGYTNFGVILGRWSAADSSIYAQVTPPGSVANRIVGLYLYMPDANNRVTFYWAGTATTAGLWARVTEGGTSKYNPTLAYDAVAHAWWKVTFAGTTVYWHTSPDGVTWTQRFTYAGLTLNLNNVAVHFEAGTSAGDIQTTLAYVDNVNVPGVAAPTAHPLTGTVAGTTATTGSPSAVHPLSGTVAGSTTTSGTIGTVVGAQAHPLAGVVTSTGSTSAPLLRLNVALAATVAAVGLVTGTPTAVHPVAGTISGTTTTTGAVTAVHPLGGTVTSTTTTTGNPAAVHPLSGTAAAASATSGTINLVGGPQVHPLSGILPATSATVGSLGQLRRALTGAVAGTSSTTGAVVALHPLAGTVGAVTASSGTIGLTGGVVARSGWPLVWTGTAWEAKPGKVWSGTAWVERPWKRWTGTEWKTIGAVPWTPALITGLVTWLDAADYTPGSWPNKSTGPTPTIVSSPVMLHGSSQNGLPTVRFKTNEGRLRSTWPHPAHDYTVVYLVRWVGPGVGRAFSVQYPPSNLTVGMHTTAADTMYDNGTWLGGYGWNGWQPPPGPWRMYGADCAQGAVSRFFVDGEFKGSPAAIDGGGLTGGWGLSGYESTGPGETMDIEVAEVLLWNRKLSDAERQQAEAYLRDRWGL